MTHIEGTVTTYYTDVKVPVLAGMQFGTNNYKMRKVGYDIFRMFFDTADKDCQVGKARIKRVLTY